MTNTTTTVALVIALAAWDAGLAVVPPREDGSKAPMTERAVVDGQQKWTWAHWQQQRPARDHVAKWYRTGRAGLGFVCGKVSGNLETLEFDDPDAYQEYKAAAVAVGLGDLVERIEVGYLEASPSGGFHWLYRCAVIGGNTELARRPKRPDEQRHPHDTIQVLIETRGEGGYIVTAPSHGPVHPTGQPYRLLRGGVATIASITPEEREALWNLARSFDQVPRPHTEEPQRSADQDHHRPGDDFNARASWDDILAPHGWTKVATHHETTYWRRPGKDFGLSATTNYGGSDLLYVFSKSTAFDPKRGYRKFSAYALLNHGGDFPAAAAELAQQGYGTVGPSSPSPSGEAGWRPAVLLTEEERQQAVRGTWVDDYVAYAGSRTDAPHNFHEALALTALSVVVGRRAVLRLSNANVYPALWIMIVADSTLYRKSTAMDLMREPLETLDRDRLAPNDFTPQRFVAVLAEHDGHPLLFIRDEFSGFYDALNRLDFMAGLKETLCNVYDGRPFRREKMRPKKTKAREEPADEEWRYDIRDPFLSLAVATTEERFADVARVNDVHSGFLPRFAFELPPDHPTPRKPITALTDAVERQRDQLIGRLRQIAATDIRLACDAAVLERFNRYVAELEVEARQAPDSSLVAIVGAACPGWRFG